MVVQPSYSQKTLKQLIAEEKAQKEAEKQAREAEKAEKEKKVESLKSKDKDQATTPEEAADIVTETERTTH